MSLCDPRQQTVAIGWFHISDDDVHMLALLRDANMAPGTRHPALSDRSLTCECCEMQAWPPKTCREVLPSFVLPDDGFRAAIADREVAEGFAILVHDQPHGARPSLLATLVAGRD